jgi:hypothetical protein
VYTLDGTLLPADYTISKIEEVAAAAVKKSAASGGDGTSLVYWSWGS